MRLNPTSHVRQTEKSIKLDKVTVEIGNTLIANTFLLCGSRVIVVDTGYTGSLSIIIKTLQNAKRTLDDVSLILITHGHTDHFGCAAELKELSGAPVAIHHLDAKYLTIGKNPDLKLTRKVRPWAMESFVTNYSKSDTMVAPVDPDIYIGDELDLNEFGIDGWVLHTPGHTLGSISVILKNNTAIVGDMIVPHPFIHNRPTLPLYGEDINLIRRSLSKLLTIGTNRFYSAHGGVFYSEQVEALTS